MTVADIYQYVYLSLATVLLYISIGRSKRIVPNSHSVFHNSPMCIIMVVLLAVFIGFRPISVGADTSQYYQEYSYVQGEVFQFDKDVDNIVYNNLIAFLGSLNIDIRALFLLMSFIYFSGIYLACKKLFPQNQEVAFMSYLVAFSTFSYGVNGMKAGVAGSIFLLALAYKDKKAISIVLAFLSVGFHHSMIVVAYAYVISFFVKNTKFFFYVWLLCTIMAVAHIDAFQSLFASIADEKGREYLLGDDYLTGFRPDFILYSAMPVLVGYIMIFKKKVHNDMYELWLRVYLTTNSVWMLCMYASYTNRIAYLSWFMYPIVLLIPFFAISTSNSQLTVGKRVVQYHLFFTLFMVIVYYGLLH